MTQEYNIQQDIVGVVVEWIEENIELPLQVSDIASRSGYSHRHIQRMFKKVMSNTLGNYIRERKLILASLALASTDEAVVNIANRYGFESHQAFTRQFTRYFGMPPVQWRKEKACYWSIYRKKHQEGICHKQQ